MKVLLKEVKAFCESNYEYGYDACVECWDDDDYLEWFERKKVTTLSGFKKSYAPLISYRAEMKSTAF